MEVNSTNDNPLFDVERGAVLSGGNFSGGHVALAMDTLRTAVASVADLLDRQLELVVDEKFNAGLTPNLIPRFGADHPEAGLHHGFKGMQLSCSALTAEALKLSNPAYGRLWQLSTEDLTGEPHISEIVEKTRSFFDDGGDWTQLKERIIERV